MTLKQAKLNWPAAPAFFGAKGNRAIRTPWNVWKDEGSCDRLWRELDWFITSRVSSG
jgi:hypothetical protein